LKFKVVCFVSWLKKFLRVGVCKGGEKIWGGGGC